MRRKLKPELDPRRAVAYLRVSTDAQALGPEAQRAAIDAWCAREGITLVAIHQDQGVCGASEIDDRPGLLAALADLQAQGAGVLVAAKRDRLARDTVLIAMIERLVEREGAKVRTADGVGDGDGPEAQLMRGLIDLFAQYERAIIRSRTRAALAVKKSRRERIGQIPYGWKLTAGGKLAPEPKEQLIAQDAMDLRARGMTLAAIGATFARTRRYPRSGAHRWHSEQIKRLLTVELATD